MQYFLVALQVLPLWSERSYRQKNVGDNWACKTVITHPSNRPQLSTRDSGGYLNTALITIEIIWYFLIIATILHNALRLLKILTFDWSWVKAPVILTKPFYQVGVSEQWLKQIEVWHFIYLDRTSGGTSEHAVDFWLLMTSSTIFLLAPRLNDLLWIHYWRPLIFQSTYFVFLY